MRVLLAAPGLLAALAAVAVLSPPLPAFSGPPRAPAVFNGPLAAVAAPTADTLRKAGQASQRLASGAAAASTAAVAATVALAFGLARSSGRAGLRRVQRQVIHGGVRDWIKAQGQNREERKVIQGYIPGEQGYSAYTVLKRPLPPPARQCLGRIYDQRLITFLPNDFLKSPVAGLEFGDVKEVGTYMTRPGSSEVVTPAAVPSYVKPKTGIRMEKEPGQKRPPVGDSEYMQYVDKHATLGEAAGKVAPGSTKKDFIAERSVLTLLLDYLNGTLSPVLMSKGQHDRAVDLVKITRAPGDGALVLERVFHAKNLWAEFRKYRGGWKRSEVSNDGTFFPAWQRLVTGDTHTKNMMVTGLWQVSGTRAGLTPKCYRFVEFALGGLSFLTRTRADATSEGKNVELKHKNFYYQDKVTLLATYYNMLLGKVDLFCMGIQRNGKVVQVVEKTPEDLMKKNPAVKDAAERRMGRLADLLRKVKGTVEGDGPWVLQWQKGELILGRYELPEEVDEAEPEDMPELVMA